MINGTYETLEMEDLGELEDLEDFEQEGLGEMEGLGEYEDLELGEAENYEYEDLGEQEFEDFEADPFLGRSLRRFIRNPRLRALLKQLAQRAAQAAGGAIAGPRGAQIANQVASRVIREAELEGEYEAESEAEFEAEFEAAGGDIEILDRMDYYAARAAAADNEAEADQFIGALASLAGPLIKSVAPSLIGGLFGGGGDEEYEDYEYEDYEAEADQFLPFLVPAITSLAAPLIKKGVGALGKALFRRRRGRRGIPAIPRIAAKAGMALARQTRGGRRITPRQVAATMAQQATRTLANPRRLATALRGSRRGARRAQIRLRGLITFPGSRRPAYRRQRPVRPIPGRVW